MSSHRDIPETAPGEPLKGFDDYELRLGDVMRGERATLGKSLLDVQRDLKIKATYIAAIENADPTAFESPGFIAGYVRSYARYLHLDPEWAYEAFCREGNFSHNAGIGTQDEKGGRKPSKSKSATPPRHPSGARDPLASPSVSFIPAAERPFSGIEPSAVGSLTVVAALIAAIGYGGWSVLQEVQKVQFTPVEQTPGVLAQLDPVIATPEIAELDEDGAALAAPSLETLDRLYRPQALDVPVLTSRDGPIATIAPETVGLFGGAASPRPDAPVGLSEAVVPTTTEVAEAIVQVVEVGPPSVTLFAVRPSWVRVRAADGTVIFEKILDAGERFELPPTEEAHTLRAGNAGSVYFSIGDQTYGPAGVGASVVREVNLSVDSVTETFALADPEADADLARFVAVAEAASE